MTDETATNHATEHETNHGVLIHGSGNSAKLTALALAAADLPVALFAAPFAAPTGSASDADWQRVLALSPSSRRMLETLGVWQALDGPTAPIHDMKVYGTADAASALLPAQLGFATPPTPDGANPDDAPTLDAPLGHIVSLAALGRALDQILAEKTATGAIGALAAPITAFDGAAQYATLADGTHHAASLLIDTQRPPASADAQPNWRRETPASGLSYDYHAAALVGVLHTTRPHGCEAQQVFLPDGPLALLPLPQMGPQADRLALVWSLPRKRAAALAAAAPELVAHELAQATQDRFGTLSPHGPMAVQDLHLHLAEDFIVPTQAAPIVLLGEAAHVIHPLAGQGFNLTLRDAAQLADTLYETRRLGLGLGDATMLADYAGPRRRAAFEMASTTHMLDALFGRPTGAALGRWGLALTQMLADRNPVLRRAFQARANGMESAREAAPGASQAEPRLLRGIGF